MTIGEYIRDYMKAHGLTYSEFASRSHLTKGYISMLVNGKNNKTGKPIIPKIETFISLAQSMGMTLDDLFREIDDMPVQIGDYISKYTNKSTESDENKQKSKAITPDIERAAIKATETLLNYNVTSAPIDPLHILKSIPGVVVVTFTEMVDESGPDRADLVTLYGANSQDAILYVMENLSVRYIVAYNQRLPYYMLQMALARELGHIILGHGDSQPGEIHTSEALLFARYLLCPRPLIKALKDANVPLTVELVGNITGCYGRYLAGIRATPGAHIPKEMNRKLKDQFSDYVEKFLEYQRIIPTDKSAKAEFGTYMDNYQD